MERWRKRAHKAETDLVSSCKCCSAPKKHFSKISAGAFSRTAAMQEGVSFFRPPPMFDGDVKNRGQSIVGSINLTQFNLLSLFPIA